MIYQLELRQHAVWNQVRSSSDLSYVQKFKDATFDRAHHTGWRIFDADRKRLKSGELAGAPKPCRRQAPGVVDVATQAHAAAEWIIETGQKVIRVFPLGKTGSHTSNKFRGYLFIKLTGLGGFYTDNDRWKAEQLAVKAGYTIIEVDPAEWVFTPDLEEAA